MRRCDAAAGAPDVDIRGHGASVRWVRPIVRVGARLWREAPAKTGRQSRGEDRSCRYPATAVLVGSSVDSAHGHGRLNSADC
jgi:hypothetical protein